MRPEVFILPQGEEYLLYAPLVRRMAVVNEGAKHAVSAFLDGEALDELQQQVIDQLTERGLFEEAACPCAPNAFSPIQVTLFPTDACNLRCRYCYAAAESGSHKMPLEVAHAAIDLVAGNAKRLGNPDFVVSFHGNGEPFMAFDVIRDCCEYADQLAKKLELRCILNVATNGVLSEAQLDYVLAWFSSVNVSCDALPDIQNTQRPFADGSGSFERVDRTLRRLDEAGLSYGIRATLTENSVGRLGEMAETVWAHYPNCQQLHVEPAWEIGRALTTGERTPAAEVFIKEFLGAAIRLGKEGPNLIYSGARHDILSNSFCSVCRGSFTVNAQGQATSCFEVATEEDPRSGTYHFGAYDFEAKQFVFDEEKLRMLSTLEVRNMDFCRDCFCKWHCAGDCAAKLLGNKPPQDHAGSDRCYINRALTHWQLQRAMGIEEGATVGRPRGEDTAEGGTATPKPATAEGVGAGR